MNIEDKTDNDLDEIPEEVDFSGAVRNKHADWFDRNTIAVVLDPDVARAFPDAESVNEALRVLIRAGERAAEHARAS